MKVESPATRILIVEDEAIVAADIKDRLVALGYDIVGIADTGAAAIAQATALKPELILMDIMLKGSMSGIEVAQHLRTALRLPVIYLSGNSDEAAFRRARDTEPFGFILKPFDEIALKANIEIALFKHRMECEREALILQLQSALAEVKTLKGLLPICAYCKKIRDDKDTWSRIETYITKNSSASFTHTFCPECAVKFYQESGLDVPEDVLAKAQSLKSGE